MELLYTLFIGLLVGLIAKLLMPGRDPGGMVITVLLGIAGAISARYIGGLLGMYQEGEPAGFIAAVIGAMLLLFIYRVARSRRIS